MSTSHQRKKQRNVVRKLERENRLVKGKLYQYTNRWRMQLFKEPEGRTEIGSVYQDELVLFLDVAKLPKDTGHYLMVKVIYKDTVGWLPFFVAAEEPFKSYMYFRRCKPSMLTEGGKR